MLALNLLFVITTAATGIVGDDEPTAVIAQGATLEKLWGEGSFTEGGAWPTTDRSSSRTSATGS